MYAKTRIGSGVVLDGQLRRIAKKFGIRKTAKNHAKYVPKAKQKVVSLLGVKIRNLKVDFKTRGTWHQVGQ